MVNLVAIQMTSVPDVDTNLAFVSEQLAQMNFSVPTLVVLPECFACFGTRDREQLALAHGPKSQHISEHLSSLAKKHGCYIVSGTYPTPAEAADKFSATCQLFGPDGQCLADYRKIHMFDVSVDDNTGSYRESKYTEPGSKVVCADTPIGRVGLAVCYDVRFPGLFDAMGDIDILVLPAAFTQRTGQAHWDTLVRARAIEKQCFVVAPNQSGVHENGRETYGHSLILSPWGVTLAEKPTGTGSISASIDLSERQALQKSMPVAQHNRFRSHFV
ncbi:carbon-nitrogen hydrolase family protein [Alteromonas sp. CYL-A6]|uniref:carbon-nitrogen hydrolase family protein n=1 Tax=Alteromonas nitratireducens TaxID=3390813 RepID=UPI0034C0C71B